MTTGGEIKSARSVRSVRSVPWPLIICAFLFTAVLLWAAVIALQAWFHTELAGEVERKVYETPLYDVDNFVGNQKALLTQYSKVASDSITVRLPIERAMELIEQADREVR